MQTTCVQAGENVGLLLCGLKRGDVHRGQVSKCGDIAIIW